MQKSPENVWAALLAADAEYADFTDSVDEPLVPGTEEWHHALAMLQKIDDLLTQLAESEITTMEGARILQSAALAHADNLKPSVYRCLRRVHDFLADMERTR